MVPQGLVRRGTSMCLMRPRGRGFPPDSPSCPGSPPHPGGRGRGRALLPPSPPSLKDIPTAHVGRFQNNVPLRHPNTLPWCLQPHGRFPSPPRYTLHDPNAPPHYNDLFPPGYTTFCLLYCHQNPIPMYEPLQSFILDPHLPIPL